MGTGDILSKVAIDTIAREDSICVFLTELMTIHVLELCGTRHVFQGFAEEVDLYLYGCNL